MPSAFGLALSSAWAVTPNPRAKTPTAVMNAFIIIVVSIEDRTGPARRDYVTKCDSSTPVCRFTNSLRANLRGTARLQKKSAKGAKVPLAPLAPFAPFSPESPAFDFFSLFFLAPALANVWTLNRLACAPRLLIACSFFSFALFETMVTVWVLGLSPFANLMFETPSRLLNAARTLFLQPAQTTPVMPTV